MNQRMPCSITDGLQYDDHDIGCACTLCQRFDDHIMRRIEKPGDRVFIRSKGRYWTGKSWTNASCFARIYSRRQAEAIVAKRFSRGVRCFTKQGEQYMAPVPTIQFIGKGRP